MTTYTWRIDNLRKFSSLDEHSDVVYEIGYTCTGTNSGGTIRTEFSKQGVYTLSTEELSSPISYNDLTEEIVQGWLNPIKSLVEQSVEAEITGNDQTVITNFPWD